MKSLILFISYSIVILGRADPVKFMGFSQDGRKLCRKDCVIPKYCPLVNCDELSGKDSKMYVQNCPEPECWDSTRRSVLWSAHNPTQYLQCHPVIGGWEAMIRGFNQII